MGIEIAPHPDICQVCKNYIGTQIIRDDIPMEGDYLHFCKAFPTLKNTAKKQ